MANRPVFIPAERAAERVRIENIEFTWSPGMSKTQKQKNVRALHRAAMTNKGFYYPLEISSKSLQEIGIALSAFNLSLIYPGSDSWVSVEVAFQSSKVFEHGGPYLDLLDKTSREAKQDERLKTSGDLVGFKWEGQVLPLRPRRAFYDFIYIKALLANPDLSERIPAYDFFTDIEFNPEKSINCQAHAAALYTSMVRLNSVSEAMESFSSFVSFTGEDKEDNRVESLFSRETSERGSVRSKDKMSDLHAFIRIQQSMMMFRQEVDELSAIINDPELTDGPKRRLVELKDRMTHHADYFKDALNTVGPAANE